MKTLCRIGGLLVVVGLGVLSVLVAAVFGDGMTGIMINAANGNLVDAMDDEDEE